MSLSSSRYYGHYDGHEVQDLEVVHGVLRQDHRGVIFLAGDSSLDNKFWFGNNEPAVNGYERVLSPPQMKTDVCYWLNRQAVERAPELCCLNTAIEATSLSHRACCALLPQDRFIRDHITADDYLIVSVGGNDIALMPVLFTILNLLALTWLTPQLCIERCACACPPNLHFDAGCADCGLPGCLSGTLTGWPLGIGYFVDLFKNRVQNYVRNLVGDRKPKKIIICMIYFLDEQSTGSWADCALSCMCYNCNPSKLQAAIRSVFRLATQNIRISGTEVVAFPLFEVLDGKDTKDYIQRVEPSPQGGAKMAEALMTAILGSSAKPSSGQTPVQQKMGKSI
eukprot:gnl/TRDRNA2_/TRDRNA2_207245_c0_seq1.p1 gnl/TRDRNA2_/TRDRNA2_207245_c0~~gnl/TRDRNA2_/TRDRNA2_207245_c0_seq1.p1  ORF type:complete len:338 (+),score=53.02 gnl/TRDRNA2_/TRDRNA2_207245_c0_seq1:64-1077(+)